MMGRFFFGCAAALSCMLTGCATLAPGSGEAVYLDVFDCLIPVPAGYAINTIDSSTTHAYTVRGAAPGRAGASSEEWGELNVWPYDGPLPDGRFDTIRSERRGRLLVEEVRSVEAAPDEPSLVLIHDGIQRLSLGGTARALADSMRDACLANPR